MEQNKPTELHAYDMYSTFFFLVETMYRWVACVRSSHFSECVSVRNGDEGKKNMLLDLFQCKYDCGKFINSLASL